MAPSAGDCEVTIRTEVPLREPYPTSRYLIYDCLSTVTHYRDGLTLKPNPLRASGSRQLDITEFTEKLEKVAKYVPLDGTLHAVDLRQESHLFFNGSAVSWFADKDWGNVGRSSEWIASDEANEIARLSYAPPGSQYVNVFCLEGTEALSVTPTGYSEIRVSSAELEAGIVGRMQLPCQVKYERIHVTDHCKPDLSAQQRMKAFCRSLFRQEYDRTWVHFHCHAGDGRTTTFLAMYDMVCWYRASGPANVPDVHEFAKRQLEIFNYNLNPSSPVLLDWERLLAIERWKWLGEWRSWIIEGGLTRKEEPADAAGGAS